MGAQRLHRKQSEPQGMNEAALRLQETSAHWGQEQSPAQPFLPRVLGADGGGTGWLLLGLTCAGAEAASSLSDSSSLLSESSCVWALTWATADPALPGSTWAVPFPEGPLVDAEAALAGRLFPTGSA